MPKGEVGAQPLRKYVDVHTCKDDPSDPCGAIIHDAMPLVGSDDDINSQMVPRILSDNFDSEAALETVQDLIAGLQGTSGAVFSGARPDPVSNPAESATPSSGCGLRRAFLDKPRARFGTAPAAGKEQSSSEALKPAQEAARPAAPASESPVRQSKGVVASPHAATNEPTFIKHLKAKAAGSQLGTQRQQADVFTDTKQSFKNGSGARSNAKISSQASAVDPNSAVNACLRVVGSHQIKSA